MDKRLLLAPGLGIVAGIMTLIMEALKVERGLFLIPIFLVIIAVYLLITGAVAEKRRMDTLFRATDQRLAEAKQIVATLDTNADAQIAYLRELTDELRNGRKKGE